MNGYAKKVGHTLLLGLAILAIALLVYLVYPKYQIFNNSGNIFKLNKITGQVTREQLPKSFGD